MSRQFEIFLSKMDSALVFGPGEYEIGFPDEIFLMESDRFGLLTKVMSVKDWDDILKALNQYPDADIWFKRGDRFIFREDGPVSVYDGKRFERQ